MPIRPRRTIPRGRRIRTLVVDDSVVIRRLVTMALAEDPAFEVVGSASSGSIALARIPQLNPDVITLDIEMPGMDGLATLREVRRTWKDLRVIMFSTLTERGAAVTLEALAAGADDYVAKASNMGSLDRSMASLRDDLIPRIKQFFVLESDRIGKPPSPADGHRQLVPSMSTKIPPKVVVIGVSTGGPSALARIVPLFPAGFPLPVLIVQHMPPLFTRLLAQSLQTATPLKVEEASEGALVQPGKVLIAPGNYHMRVVKRGGSTVVAVDQEQPENSCRPAVDVLFRSTREVYGGATIAVVLTGMGTDGLRGVEILKTAGAYVIAQDEATSVVWGMPGAVAGAGLADAVVPLDEVMPMILKRMSL